MSATIRDQNGSILGLDYAEEVRGSSNINKTSALENCSTSAIGRALCAAGYNKTGTGVASAEEVTVAIERQKKEPKLTKKQRQTIEKYLDSCSDGDLKLERLLDWANVDNLSELPKAKALQWIDKNLKTDVIA